MHYQAHPLLTNFVSWRINTRKHWLSIAEKQHNINPFDAYPLTKLLFWGLSLLTCESVVNTCAVFLLCPLSVAVTYPNVLGWRLSRTTQQTLLISWEVTSSCENTKNVWKIVCFCRNVSLHFGYGNLSKSVESFFGLPVFLATTVAQFETLQFSAKQVNALMVTIVYHLSRQVLHFSLEVRIEAPP